jgi:hypothetical protein
VTGPALPSALALAALLLPALPLALTLAWQPGW